MSAAQAMQQQNQDAATRARRNAEAELENFQQIAAMAQQKREEAEEAAKVAGQWNEAAEGAALRYKEELASAIAWEEACK